MDKFKIKMFKIKKWIGIILTLCICPIPTISIQSSSSYKVYHDYNVTKPFQENHELFMSKEKENNDKYKCLKMCNLNTECFSVVQVPNKIGSFDCFFYRTDPTNTNQVSTELSSTLYVIISDEFRMLEHYSRINPVIDNTSIQSEFITNWGSWNDPEYCPPNSFAIGFNVKIDSSGSTGLNAIKLICNDNLNTVIQSGEGQFGDWDSYSNCSGIKRLVGFRFKVEPVQSMYENDSSANGIQMFCEGNSTLVLSEGPEGNWGEDKYCPGNQIICGVQSQIEPYQYYSDDTSLNNVVFFCCNS